MRINLRLQSQKLRLIELLQIRGKFITQIGIVLHQSNRLIADVLNVIIIIVMTNNQVGTLQETAEFMNRAEGAKYKERAKADSEKQRDGENCNKYRLLIGECGCRIGDIGCNDTIPVIFFGTAGRKNILTIVVITDQIGVFIKFEILQNWNGLNGLRHRFLMCAVNKFGLPADKVKGLFAILCNVRYLREFRQIHHYGNYGILAVDSKTLGNANHKWISLIHAVWKNTESVFIRVQIIQPFAVAQCRQGKPAVGGVNLICDARVKIDDFDRLTAILECRQDIVDLIFKILENRNFVNSLVSKEDTR